MIQEKQRLHGTSGSATAPPEPLHLGYAHGMPLHPVAVELHEPRRARSALGTAVLAVVDGDEGDRLVTDLGGDLASALGGPFYVARPLKVPAALPMRLSADELDSLLDGRGRDLDPITSGGEVADAYTLLCRQVGASLVAEATERRCAAVVVGAPHGGWLARWRRRSVIRYLLRHAPCRVYVVEGAGPAHLAGEGSSDVICSGTPGGR